MFCLGLDIAWGAGLAVGRASEMTEGVAIVRVEKTLLGPRLLIHGGLKWRWFWWHNSVSPAP